MSSVRICSVPLICTFLLLFFCQHFAALQQNSPHIGRRDVGQTANGGERSSSINTEEDLGGLNTEWLTDDQLSELTSAGSNKERMEKLRGFYDNLEGEARKVATKKIIEECYGWMEEVATEEERNALKQMHHQNHDQCRAKVRELVERLSEERREQVEKRTGFCEHVYYGKMDGEGGSGAAGDEHHHNHGDRHGPSKRWAHRHRRDHHHHSGHEGHHGEHGLEDYFTTHLAWLTDDQKGELRQMKESRKSRSDIKQKVIEWYDATAGDAREKATELLKGGCRELIKMVLGEEKANKLKEMKESGSEVAKISEQINAWIDELTDAKKKELANEYRGVCARVFGVKGQAGGRKRRSWHGRRHNLRQRNHQQEEEGEVRLEGEDEGGPAEEPYEVEGEHLQHHNRWLSRKQKQMLKKLQDRGHEDHELHERIHEFYDVSPEEVKATARGILQRGCESILKRIFGEYKAEEIIQMRDEGATNDEMEQKITEALDQIRNAQKREEAGRFAMSCRRIFAMIDRRRRSAESTAEHSLEGLFKSHLSWLSEQQREELKQLKEAGKGRTQMQQKVMGWYEQLEGQAKEQAREHLRNGCRELLAHLLGKEKGDQLKRLREDGMSGTELEAKANEMVDEIQEEEKKTKAKELGTACGKILLDGTGTNV